MNPCRCGRLHADDLDRVAHALADHIIETEVVRATEAATEAEVAALAAMIVGKRPRRPRRVPDFEAYYRFLAPYEARFKRAMRAVWDDQRRIVVANVKRTPARATDGDRESVAAFNALFEQWMYPAAPARKQVAATYRKVAAPLMTAQGRRTADELAAIAGGMPQGRSVKTNPVSISWTLYNGMVDTWLDGYMIDLADEIEVESLERLKRALQAGWQAGQSIPDLVNQVNSVFGDFSSARSEIIARTESIRASAEAALLTYEASGVVDRKMWVATPTERTCDICLGLDGKVVGLNQSFPFNDTYGDASGPPAHPNCVLPGTLCLTPGGIAAGYRARYDGPIIEMTFANGATLSVTPNHMLLTPHGFASAQLLREGDDVFYRADFEREVAGDPNDDGQPSAVEKIVETLTEAGGMATRRVPVAAEYLHGDGRFCNGNVDVVWPNGLLDGGVNPIMLKPLGADCFGPTCPKSTRFSGFGPQALLLHRMAAAASGGVGGFRESHPFFLRRAGHTQGHGLAATTGADVAFQEALTNDVSGDSKLLGDGLLGDPGDIQGNDLARVNVEASGRWVGAPVAGDDSGVEEALADVLDIKADGVSDALKRQAGLIQTTRIVHINTSSWHGDVYDLQTLTSLYIANGIVSSNCRCTIVPVLEGEEL